MFFAVLLFAFQFGCDKASDARAGEQSPSLSEVRLGYFPNVTHAQAVLGVTSGDFERAVAPVKFSPQPFNAGPALIQALLHDQIDVGYVGPGPVMNAYAISHGEGIRVISGAAANGVLIVARKDSGIATMADLRGRRIATPQRGNTQDIAARHYLLNVLGQRDTENVLPISNSNQFSLMQQGQIDAAWDPEPWGSMLIAKAGAHQVGEEKDLWPGKEFSLTVIVTTPEFLAKHSDLLAKLLAVNRDWTHRLNDSPGACVPQLEAALAALTGKPLPRGVVASSVAHVKFTEEPLPATLEADDQWAFDLGFARQKSDLSKLTDLSVLQKLPKR
jgi:NitT/TauT family transport system substrate-binding protein